MSSDRSNSKLEITQVTPAYPPASGYGGGPKVCNQISTELVDRGYTVNVYTTNADDRKTTLPTGKQIRDDVKVHRLELVNNRLTYKFKVFFTYGFAEELKKNDDSDIYHIHDFRTPLSVTAIRDAKHRDIPTILQPHGTVPRKNRLVFWKRFFDAIWGKELFNSISHWFALNTEEEEALINHGVDKNNISIIPNGIDLNSVPVPTPGIFRDKYNIPYSKDIILYLGRLHQSKRVDLLINALSKLNNDHYILIIAGFDDGDERRLKNISSNLDLEDQVRFIGRVSDNEKWQAYQDANLFVTPSFYGFPLTFLEAMSQQTPVLTTSLGDTIEESADNGIFVLDGTVESLATKIDELLGDTERLDAAGQSAYERVKNEYTWENVVDKIENKYCEL